MGTLPSSTDPPASGGAEVPPGFTPPPAQELRQYGRFKIDGAVGQVKVHGVLSFVGLGPRVRVLQAVDLSEGGALLVLDRRLRPGQPLRVRIDMPKYSDHIEAEAEVRWCFQDARNSKQFFVGVMFTELDDAQTAKISVMRRWFTSKEYRAKTTRRWVKPPADDPKK
jgi:hypothetical protein